MIDNSVAAQGVVLLGCGKMGSAMLEGWLAGGLPASCVHVIDPAPSDWLRSTGVHLNQTLPDRPAILILAIKPQMMDAALPQAESLGGGDTLVLSIAAGTMIHRFQAVFGAPCQIRPRPSVRGSPR